MKHITGLILSLAIALAPVLGDTDLPFEPRMVAMRIIAFDDNGKRVDDLTADDFQVADAGKKQEIAVLRYNPSSDWKAPNLGPNEFSNRGKGEIPHATVILFDLMNESFGTKGVALNQIVQTLSRLETADYLYLYILTVDGKLFIVHGFPGAIGAPRASNAEPWTRNIKSLMDQAMRTVTSIRRSDIDVFIRIQLTLAAINTLGAELSRVPGRKNLVWITDGVPIELGPMRSDTGDFVDFTPYIRQLSEALDQTATAIYPTRQVMFGAYDGIGSTSGASQTGGAGTGLESEETLNEFAAMTGGRLDRGKDVRVTVTQALSDAEGGYYFLGYYPPKKNWNDKFHKLVVTCTRKGVHLQTKTGYYAWSQPAGTRTQMAFDMLSSTTFDAAEIGLTATASRDMEDLTKVHVDLHINAHDVALVPEGNDYFAHMRVSAVGYLQSGGAVRSRVIPFVVHYTGEQRDKALREGIDFPDDLQLSPEEDRVRLIVFDQGTDSVGSITIPVKAIRQAPPPPVPNTHS